MKHILVPTDFSAPSKAALRYAVEYAELNKGSAPQLTILSVLEEVIPAGVQFEFGSSYIDTKSVIDEAERQATKKIDELREEYQLRVKAEAQVIRAVQPVHSEIIEFAKKNAVDLIVMATHGRTGIRRLILGSVAEKIVREAPCPVLIVPVQQ